MVRFSCISLFIAATVIVSTPASAAGKKVKAPETVSAPQAAPAPALSPEEAAAPKKPTPDARAWLGQTSAIRQAAIDDSVLEWRAWTDSCATYWHDLPSHKKEADRLEAVYLHCPLQKEDKWFSESDITVDCLRVQKKCDAFSAPQSYRRPSTDPLEASSPRIVLSNEVLAKIWKERVLIVQKEILAGSSPLQIQELVANVYERIAEESVSRQSKNRRVAR